MRKNSVKEEVFRFDDFLDDIRDLPNFLFLQFSSTVSIYIFAILQNVGANHRKYQVVIVIKQKTSSSTFLSDVSEFCEF